jgi:cytochrome c553
MFNDRIRLALLLSLFINQVYAADSANGQNRSTLCQGCHGATGNNTNQGVPNLAGQPAGYLEAQLNSFKAGFRENPVMKSMTINLGNEDIQDIAAYFSRQSAGAAGGDSLLVEKGKAKVSVCMGCHGEKLIGQGHNPRLAGQHPEYLSKQLNDFKSGSRSGAPMNAIAKTLSDDDIKAITAYLGSLK